MLDPPIISPTDDPSNTNLSLSDLEIFACEIRWLSYRLNLWSVYRFCFGSLLNPSPTFPRLGMSISLDLILLSNMTGSYVNLSSSNNLGRHVAWVEFTQEFLAQLSSAIKLCSLVLCFDLWIASLLILNLMTTFTCYPSIVWCLFLQPIRWHLKCHIVCAFNNGVTISILWCRDETESLLWAHTQGCAARHALVSGLLVMIHYKMTTDVLFLVILFPWLSPYVKSEHSYLWPIVVELPPEVAKRTTFEE
jgi:hypothetical protein